MDVMKAVWLRQQVDCNMCWLAVWPKCDFGRWENREKMAADSVCFSTLQTWETWKLNIKELKKNLKER